jgi:RNA polymerase sigma-70 factor (ECF subfamily)
MNADQTSHLQRCLDRLHAGDEAARNELVACAYARFDHLTRQMLQDFPGVQRHEQAEDVLHSAMVRLLRALHAVTPPSVRDFYRLAALQIRRELLDLARHYQALPGLENQPAGNPSGASSTDTPRSPAGPSDSSSEPSKLAVWSEFHCRVEALPAAEQEVVDLLWYQGLPQAEAAALLHVDVRTLKRRWQAARLTLAEVLPGARPGM